MLEEVCYRNAPPPLKFSMKAWLLGSPFEMNLDYATGVR